ncbi:hypothetical protein JXO52_17575 [bacterium]|nr:hypothetical protein [bacterium]
MKILLITLLAVPLVSVYFDPENEQAVIRLTLNYAFDQVRMEKHTPDDIVFLGDSRLISGIDMGILQQHRHFTYSNISGGGLSFLEGYYLLKYYLENHLKPGIVVLSFVPSIQFFPPTLFGHFGLPTVRHFRFLDLVETGYMGEYFIRNLERNRKTLYRMALTCAGKDTLVFNKPFPFFGMQTMPEISRLYRQNHGFMIWSRDPERIYSRTAVFRWDAEISSENRELDPTEIQYFRRMIDLLERHHVRKAFLLLPLHEAVEPVYETYTKGRWNAFVGSFDFNVIDNTPRYYDYTEFVDDSHLNVRGRIQYNTYLVESGILDSLLDSRDQGGG